MKLNSDTHKEINIWLIFLQSFNGVSLLSPLNDHTLDYFQFQPDASGWGCAAIYRDQWFKVQWAGVWCHTHIVVHEFLPIVFSLFIWGQNWHHSHLHFFCDNEAVVDVINRQSAYDPLMLALLHYVTLLALRFDLFIHATHLPGKFLMS